MGMMNLEGENNPKNKPKPNPKWILFLHHILIASIIYPMTKQAGTTKTCLNSLWGYALDNFGSHNSLARAQQGRRTAMLMEMDKPVHTCSAILVLSLETAAAFVFRTYIE